jgi:hypothetical protein
MREFCFFACAGQAKRLLLRHQMSVTPPHTLSHPHLDKLAGLAEPSGAAGEEEIERRAQELLFEWQKFYFSGVPFTSPRAGKEDVTRAFEHCDVLWDHATPAIPAPRTIMHSVLADRRDGDSVSVGNGLYKTKGVWTWNTFIRSHPQLPAGATGDTQNDAARNTAFRSARRVGDQYSWLIRSPHAQDLAYKGLSHIRILNGPRPIQSGAWFLRQIVFSTEVSFLTCAG